MLTVVPSPSCPNWLLPHAQRDESIDRIAIVWELEDEVEITFQESYEIGVNSVCTVVGYDLVIVIPLPSWPDVLMPHIYNVLLLIAAVCVLRKETELILFAAFKNGL